MSNTGVAACGSCDYQIQFDDNETMPEIVFRLDQHKKIAHGGIPDRAMCGVCQKIFTGSPDASAGQQAMNHAVREHTKSSESAQLGVYDDEY